MTKADLNEATDADTFNLAEILDLAVLKAELDKIDIDQVKTVPVDLSKLRNVVDNDIVKKLCIINWSLRLMPLALLSFFKTSI